MKLLSVIITTYNSAKFITNTLDSIFNQTGLGQDFELEVLVSDDASADGTIDILKTYPHEIKLLLAQQNSGGPNAGRNRGLKKATGDFICIADHDDLWQENKVVSLLPHLERAPILSCGYQLRDISLGFEKERLENTAQGKLTHYGLNKTFEGLLKRNNNRQKTYLGTLVFSNQLKNVLFEENFGMIDYDWLLRLFHNNSSAHLNVTLHTRLVDGANLSLNEEYRLKNHFYSLYTNEFYRNSFPSWVSKSEKRLNASLAKYYYLKGSLRKARYFFLKSGFSIKNMAYYLTTFVGRKWVLKKFNVFG
jgi:glycosyltransferase involved in cell wall biosynthesis